ncbi:MAG TPA: SIMPL domain-containing protein [Solirubrobacterales bacterium]|nr:SIMPL domain-containing protein [Solirubrobacterales bacterium]
MRRFVFLLVIAAGLLVAPTTAVAAERTVSVTATVEREVPNDTAEVHFSVSKERAGRAAALHVVAVRVRGVIEAARAIPGVGPGDVTTGSVSVRRVKKGKRPVYRASEGVTVVTHQPEDAGSLVAAGVAAGATSTRGPNFFVGDREAAYDAALVEAFNRAKAKAAMLATAAGATLGPAITITEGGAVTPINESAASEPASKCVAAPEGSAGTSRRKAHASACATPPPVKPGKSTVRASVDATFALQ